MAWLTKLTNLPGSKSLKYVRCKYSPINTPTGHRRNRFAIETNTQSILMREIELYKLAQRPLNTLWWAVISQIQLKPAVTRNRARRRFKGAMIAALEENGYDAMGRNLSSTGPDIKGSLEISIVDRGVLLDSFELLKADARAIVNEVVWRTKLNMEAGTSKAMDHAVIIARRKYLKHQKSKTVTDRPLILYRAG